MNEHQYFILLSSSLNHFYRKSSDPIRSNWTLVCWSNAMAVLVLSPQWFPLSLIKQWSFVSSCKHQLHLPHAAKKHMSWTIIDCLSCKRSVYCKYKGSLEKKPWRKDKSHVALSLQPSHSDMHFCIPSFQVQHVSSRNTFYSTINYKSFFFFFSINQFEVVLVQKSKWEKWSRTWS